MGRVVIVSAVFPPEPLVTAMLSRDIAERLSVTHKVTVLCPEPTRPQGYHFSKKEDTPPYEVVRLPSFTSPESKVISRLKESRSFGRHCAKYIQNHKNEIDVIYANTWPLFAQKEVVEIAGKHHIPSVLHVQDIYPESIAKKLPVALNKTVSHIFIPMDRSVLLKATLILGISNSMIDYLSSSRRVPLSKFELIRNWQSDEAFVNHIPKEKETEAFIYMYVGSIAPSAGVENVIRAYDKLPKKNNRLVIAGNGADKAKCIQLANDLNNGSIEFLEISPDKVPELQSKADVLILPLKKGIALTATPSKLTAYLLSAKPVIACVEDHTDVADIIKNGECGIIVPPEEIELLTNAMHDVGNLSKEKLNQMGQNSREYALKELSKEVNLKKLTGLIEKLISK
jgi:glycosyltransferase involved in cell wall biosynthesis